MSSALRLSASPTQPVPTRRDSRRQAEGRRVWELCDSPSARPSYSVKGSQSGANPGAFGMVDSGYIFLDKISRKDTSGAWMQGYIDPNPSGQTYTRIARSGLPEYEFTSQNNEWASTVPGSEDTFRNYGGRKLFFGTVRWTGANGYKEPPIKVGQDLLWVHVPGHTFKTGVGITPDLSRPLPIQVDKNGRFGLIIPGGVTHVFVKMYGTLWKKVVFDGLSSNTHNLQSWDVSQTNFLKDLELRYGDVNEDNKIIRTVNDPDRDRDYLNDRVGGELRMDDENPTEADLAIFAYDYVCDLNRDNRVDGDDGDRDFFDSFLQPAQDLDGAQIP